MGRVRYTAIAAVLLSLAGVGLSFFDGYLHVVLALGLAAIAFAVMSLNES